MTSTTPSSESEKNLNNQQLKSMRAIAHKLKPVVTIAQNGLSEGVCKEIERALKAHELIKLKIVAGDREARREISSEISRITGAQCVQGLGNTAVFFRAASKPDPKLSNLLRHAKGK